MVERSGLRPFEVERSGQPPFAVDAILMIAFGGPTCPEEIRPFLQHVLRGRPVPPSRIEEVAHHYEVIGGRSPINDLTYAQRDLLAARLGTGPALHVGMWHASPFIADVLSELAGRGVRRVLGVVMAALHDGTTLDRYRAAVDEAIRERALPIEVRYAGSPETHPGNIAANVAHLHDAYARLPEALRPAAELIFTAHSVPASVGRESGYVARFETLAARVAEAAGLGAYRLAYQSRSGNPRDPWLEPDIGAVIRERHAAGARALVLAPIGFVCDHVEVLYDLDVEAAAIAAELGVTLARASTVNNHPAYIDALADTVRAASAS